MSLPLDRGTRSLPAIHGQQLADLVTRWGIPTATFLQGTGLSPSELSQPQNRLSVAMMERLVERARALTGEPALGIYFGLQMRISWHGYVGLAAMTAQNARQALELITRFVPTRTDALVFSLEHNGSVASLFIHEQADFGTARDAVILALLVGIWQLACSVTGQPIQGTADVAMPEPSYITRFKDKLPRSLRFGQPENRLVFDAEMLELPMIAADPAALILIREQMERDLDALGITGSFRERVRALVLRGNGGMRSIEEIAAQLCVSSRTLKRKLAELDTSYSALLEEERQQRSATLLRTTTLSMEEIAERLGYSGVSCFIRAFRRWTGHPPGTFRQSRDL